jgi:hypothetical protein
VIVVCGGAEGLGDPGRSTARRIIASAVVDAAQETGAAVVDGGTASGVMELVGEECGDQSGSVLVGVAPAGRVSLPGEEEPGRVPLERHHTHFVLHDSDAWGNETELLIELSAELAAGAHVIMVLAGGGAGAQAEVQAAAARGWPVFVIEGTGGMADEIAARCRSPRRRARADDLNEVITQGTVETLSGDDARGAARRLIWELQDEPALKDAWMLCAAHDELAARLRTSYERFQVIVVLLAVTATVLALLHQQLGGSFLHWAAIPAPVLVSVLIALVSRRAVGRRWLVLRAAAEAIKSETYRYRTRTGVYAGPLTAAARARRSQRLSARLGVIEAELMRTEASCGPLQPYVGPLPPSMCAGSADHDVLSPLDAGGYVAVRLGDQISYYHSKTKRLDRRRRSLQVLTAIAGGAGAVLAAAGFEIWIALTTAVSTAALTFLGATRVDSTIVAYNHSASRLAALQRGFRAARRADLSQAAFDRLVEESENVLLTEVAGWLEQMSDAMRPRAQMSDAGSDAQSAEETPALPETARVHTRSSPRTVEDGRTEA